MGLHKAVKDYNPAAGVTFIHFAQLCIQRNVITAVKTATRGKKSPMNEGISLAKPLSPEGDETVGDRLALREPGPVEESEQRELVRRIFWALGDEELLTKVEREAIIGIELLGDDYETVARRIGSNRKAVDNAVQRARGKLVRFCNPDRRLRPAVGL
jgi:RNA polymerase sporulation-specific sigma factor